MQSGVKLTVAAWAALGLAVAAPLPSICIQNPRLLAGVGYVQAMLGRPESAAYWMSRARQAEQRSSTAASTPAVVAGTTEVKSIRQAAHATAESASRPPRVESASCRTATPAHASKVTLPVPPAAAAAYAASFVQAAMVNSAELANLKLTETPRLPTREEIAALIRSDKRNFRVQYHISIPRPPRRGATPIG